MVLSSTYRLGRVHAQQGAGSQLPLQPHKYSLSQIPSALQAGLQQPR